MEWQPQGGTVMQERKSDRDVFMNYQKTAYGCFPYICSPSDNLHSPLLQMRRIHESMTLVGEAEGTNARQLEGQVKILPW